MKIFGGKQEYQARKRGGKRKESIQSWDIDYRLLDCISIYTRSMNLSFEPKQL